MAKTKAKKVTKPTKKATKRTSGGSYANEYDFIIIAGGGLVVMMLTFFLFLR